MEMTEKQKNWIDTASYYQLLKQWRFAPAGDPIFQGEVGNYYSEIMSQRKKEVGNENHVATSKSIGW